jgi:hypothetical protein
VDGANSNGPRDFAANLARSRCRKHRGSHRTSPPLMHAR